MNREHIEPEHDGDRTQRSPGRLSATVSEVDDVGVEVMTNDGRRWTVAASDFPEALARVGQPISLVHDADGWVTEILEREKEAPSPELQARLAEMERWIDSL